MRYFCLSIVVLAPTLIAAEPVLVRNDDNPDAKDLVIRQHEGPRIIAVDNNGVPTPTIGREAPKPALNQANNAPAQEANHAEAPKPQPVQNDDGALQIGRRDGTRPVEAADTPSVNIGKRERLSSSLKAEAYQKEIEKIAKELGCVSGSPADAKVDEALKAEIQREPDRSGAAFGTLLDPRNAPDAKVRKGAAIGIGLSNASTKVVGKALANAALSETDADARNAAISTIQQRKDAMALHGLMTKLEESMDPDGLGIVNEKQRDQALAALHDIGDKRIYHAILYYVTLEIRAGTASLVALNQTFITNSGDVNNGAVGRTSINLPIDLPTLELNSVQGVITVPAICQPQFALRKVTGQDFGKDIDKWRAWIDKQPDMRK